MDDIERKIREQANAIVEEHEKTKEQSAVEAFNQKIDFQIDATKSYSEQAKDLVGVKATERAIADEDLAKNVTDRKKAEIINHADASLKKEEAENKKAETILQEANYGVYKGVANYAGIKKPLPQKMQKILFTMLSAFQLIVLIAIGFPISIINISLDSVDSVINKMRTVTLSARVIVLVVLLGCVGWMIFLIIKYLLVKNGIFL
jgi:hypothetical protein